MSKRRLAENEAVFRQLNEQVKAGVDEINKLALEDRQPEFMVEPEKENRPIYFFCECADENCSERILLNLKEYRKIHRDRNSFIVVPGHQVKKVERVTSKRPDFYIVEKNIDAPEDPQTLHTTSIHNV